MARKSGFDPDRRDALKALGMMGASLAASSLLAGKTEGAEVAHGGGKAVSVEQYRRGLALLRQGKSAEALGAVAGGGPEAGVALVAVSDLQEKGQAAVSAGQALGQLIEAISKLPAAERSRARAIGFGCEGPKANGFFCGNNCGASAGIIIINNLAGSGFFCGNNCAGLLDKGILVVDVAGKKFQAALQNRKLQSLDAAVLGADVRTAAAAAM